MPDGRRWWRRVLAPTDGIAFDAAYGHLDAAEASLLRMAPPAFVAGHLPSIAAQVNRHLPKADPRRVRVEEVAHDARRDGAITPLDLEGVVTAFHAAGSQRRRELMRVRSFLNVLLGTTVALTLVAIAVGLVGWRAPHALPLCFNPEGQQGEFKVVCPLGETAVTEDGAPVGGPQGDLDEGLRATFSGGDIVVVELAGLLAAALAAATLLRGLRGTSTPYGVPLMLAVLKLPAGALTAVVGLLLMRGGFVPGLSALDTSAQIIAWAVVFGYSQQLLTSLVDRQAHGVLSDVGGRRAGGERQPRTL